MSDTKVLRLVKKPEGDQRETALAAKPAAALPAVTPVRLPERAKSRPRKSTPPIAVAKPRERPQLSREEMLKIYRTMYLSRKLDDKEIQMKGQNRICFQISGAGHEAILVAACIFRKPAYHCFYPY